MAIRFDNATDYIRRTTNLPDYNSVYTIMGWFRLVSNLNSYGALFILAQSASSYDGLYLGASGNDLVIIGDGNFLGYVETAVQTLTTGVDYHLALVRNSPTSLQAFVNGALAATQATDQGTGRAAANVLESGNFFYAGSEPVSARVSHIKAWDANLSADEIAREVNSIRPVKLDNLNAWYPTLPGATERLADYSGNGRNWTAGGTLTDEDGPPVSWGGMAWALPFVEVGAEPEGVEGSVVATLPAPAADFDGGVAVEGGVSATLSVPAVALAGGAVVDGQVAITLPMPTVALAAAAVASGTISVTLPAPSVGLVGQVALAGALDRTLPVPAVVLTAEVEIDSQVAVMLPVPTISLVGAIGDVPVTVVGGVVATLSALSVALVAAVEVVGQLDAVLPAPSVSVSGGVGVLPVIGGIEANLPAPSALLGGEVVVAATVVAVLPVPSVALAGQAMVAGMMVAMLPASTVAWVGELAIEGAVDALLPAPGIEIAGYRARIGQMEATLPSPGIAIGGMIGAIVIAAARTLRVPRETRVGIVSGESRVYRVRGDG